MKAVNMKTGSFYVHMYVDKKELQVFVREGAK